MATWLSALSRTRKKISETLAGVFSKNQQLDDVSLEELEETLIGADVPVRLVGELIDELACAASSRHDAMRAVLLDALGESRSITWTHTDGPLTVLLVGINGAGKTTTAAKLAHRARNAGNRPLLGAADTFRAAGSHQLRIWADRLGCDAVVGETGADAAAVAYDALDAAIARSADVLFIDTAGRMHTKQPLMQELSKVQKALSKRLEGAPHETWIVLDASLGQNAVLQAKTFHESCPLTGVIITKIDGSSKGGFVFSVARELGVPILFAGLGEGEDDLVPFDRASFVDALLGDHETHEILEK